MALNPLSKEAFRQWVAKQPAGKTYLARDGANCAIAQYAKSLGFKKVHAGVDNFVARDPFKKRFGIFPAYEKHHIQGLEGWEIFSIESDRVTFGTLLVHLTSLPHEPKTSVRHASHSPNMFVTIDGYDVEVNSRVLARLRA